VAKNHPKEAGQQALPSITDEADVCSVTAEHFLTPAEREAVLRRLREGGGGGYTLPVHWRRAHKRRERGRGQDPNAPKSIPVKAALVNRHLLEEGHLPGGARTILK